MANFNYDEEDYDQLDLNAQDRMDEILDRQEQGKPLFTERPIPKIDTGTTTIEASAPREDIMMGGSRGYGLGVEGVSRPSKYGLGLTIKEPELDKAEAVRRYVMAKRGVLPKTQEVAVADEGESDIDKLEAEGSPDPIVTIGYEDPNKEFVKDSGKIYPYWENIPKDELIDPNMKEPVNSRRSPIDWRVGDPDVDAERAQRSITREAERAPFVDARNKDNTQELQNRAYNANMIADVGQGLGQIFTAGTGVQFDPSVMNKLRDRASRLPDEASKRRQQAIQEYVLERKLGKEAVQELQDARKKDLEVQLMNPNSDISRAVQQNFKRVYGKYLAQGGDESKAFITTDADGKEFDYLDQMPATEVFKLSEMLGDKLKADQMMELNKAKLGYETDLGQKKLDIDQKRAEGELDVKGKALQQKAPVVEADIRKRQAEIDKINAEIERIKAGNKAVDEGKALPSGVKQIQDQSSPKIPKEAVALAKEYTSHPVTKVTDKMASDVENIKSFAQKPTPAGDLSMIFSYMRMLDPNSTVREGEFATAQNTAGVPDQVRNIYNKALQGTRLNDRQRADFAGQADRIYKNQLSSQKRIYDQYYDRASRFGLDPDQVLGGFTLGQKEEAPTQSSGFRPYNPSLSASDKAALDWLQKPESQNHPSRKSVEQKLKGKGLL